MLCICGTDLGTGAFCTNCGRKAISPSELTLQESRTSLPVSEGSNKLSTWAITLGVIGFFFVPIVLGVIAIILGKIAKTRGESRANLALGIAISGTVLSILIGVATF